jgi:nucleotide-binding universal stress UspA family protein
MRDEGPTPETSGPAREASELARAGDPVPELLVPFDGSRGAEKVLRRACRAARRDRAGLEVLCVVHPPDRSEDRLDVTAMQALIRAQVICREEGVVGVFKLYHDRSLSHAILAEAYRSGAVLIGLSLRERAPGETDATALMSETVQAVLAAAPCAVLLDDPEPELLPPWLGQSF